MRVAIGRLASNAVDFPGPPAPELMMPTIHPVHSGLNWATGPRSHATALLLLVLAPFASAQNVPTPSALPAPPTLCAAFDVAAATVQHLVPERATNGDIAVPIEFGGVLYTIALRPFDVRSPNFRLLVNDATGLHQVPTPPSVTYRGSLLEDPSSWVAASIEGDTVAALVHLGSGTEWAVQPVSTVQHNVGPAAHVVYRTADNANLPWHCGVAGGLTGPVTPPLGRDLSYVCDIALEADPAFYQRNSSNVVATQNDMTTVINAVSAIYTNDVQLSYNITQIIVNVTGSDPYSSSVAGTLLGQFQSNWNANHSTITRATAHLFTGRNMGQASGGAIGIAYVGVVCSLGSAYGVSQSRFTTNLTQRVAVTAHEIGHNFSAQHCDATPPCNIMCSGIGGCANVQTTFSQNERNQIVGYMQGASCLRVIPNAPVIATALPSQVRALTPGVLSLTGSGFVGTNMVQVGTAQLTSGFSAASDTSMSVSLPQPSQLGPVSVQTSNISGTSNAVTVTYVASSPCEVLAPVAVLGGSTLTWSMAGQPNNVWVLLTGGSNTTSPFLGWPILDNSSIFALGLLSPTVGFATQSVTVPGGVLAGVTVYSQVAELLLGSATLTVVSSSTIKSTFVVN